MKRILIFFVAIALSCVAIAQPNPDQQVAAFSVEVVGEGEPVVLIPGLASSGAVWQQTVEQLQDQYECHILTLAGFAEQPPINLENGYLPVIQQHLTSYLQENLEKKAILIGHSLGGYLAMAIASTTPEVVQKIVVVDAYPFYSAAMTPNITAEMAKPHAQQMKNMLLDLPTGTFARHQKTSLSAMITDSAQVALATEWSLQSDRATTAQAIYEIMTSDLRPKMTDIHCPILVLGSWSAAKEYGITQETVEKTYRKQFTGAKDYVLWIADTAKHFIMWDEPNWFYEKLKRFL